MQPGFTLISAFAKASAVALRAMADKTADRLALSRSTRRLSTGRQGREDGTTPGGPRRGPSIEQGQARRRTKRSRLEPRGVGAGGARGARPGKTGRGTQARGSNPEGSGQAARGKVPLTPPLSRKGRGRKRSATGPSMGLRANKAGRLLLHGVPARRCHFA